MTAEVLKVGQRIEVARRTMTYGKLLLFHGGNASNHTDYDIAEAQHLPAPMAGGMMLISHLSNGFCSLFGTRWLEGGSLEVKFLDYVFPNTETVYTVTVVDIANEVLLDVEATTTDNRLVMVGKARVPALRVE